MGTRLYVGNLSFHTGESAVQAAFAAFGTVVEAKVVTDRDTGRSRGFAFVTMGSEDEARRAIAGMDGKDLEGRALRVNEAEERAPRGGGRAYGGR
jgi:RNA recognition motif-containing protein